MTHASEWLSAPLALRIEPAEVHVWRATDQDVSADCQTLLSLLNPNERARADGFKFERDRNRFIFCRGALRQLLGRYTSKPPEAVAFIYGPFGKPSLSSGTTGIGAAPLHFNVSHTNGLSLFAFSPTLPVGIDAEAIDSAHDWQATARRFFHPNEWTRLEHQPRSSAARLGYELWTCKEAYLKACGEGVGGGLEAFEVMLPPEPGCEGRIDPAKDFGCGAAYLRSLDVGAGFAAALVTLGSPDRVTTWNWQPG